MEGNNNRPILCCNYIFIQINKTDKMVEVFRIKGRLRLELTFRLKNSVLNHCDYEVTYSKEIPSFCHTHTLLSTLNCIRCQANTLPPCIYLLFNQSWCNQHVILYYNKKITVSDEVSRAEWLLWHSWVICSGQHPKRRTADTYHSSADPERSQLSFIYSSGLFFHENPLFLTATEWNTFPSII